MIDSLIFDCHDSGGVGCVDYSHWLTSFRIGEGAQRLRMGPVVKPTLTYGIIAISGLKRGDYITIYNGTGRVVKRIKSGGKTADIDLGKLSVSQGVYFIRIESGNNKETFRVVYLKDS